MEIGVQSVYEDIARDTNRGHTVRSVCESFHLSKDCGYKIVSRKKEKKKTIFYFLFLFFLIFYFLFLFFLILIFFNFNFI